MKNKCMKWRDQLLEAALTPQPAQDRRALGTPPLTPQHAQDRRALGTPRLAETTENELSDHLSQCAGCTAELATLRARRRRMDSLLPLVANAEPSPNLRARILAAAETGNTRKRSTLWRLWAPAAAAVVMIAVMSSLPLNRTKDLSAADLRSAQALAQWHAPTDIFLQTPGQEILKTVPKLGESYLEIGSGSAGRKRPTALDGGSSARR